MRHVPWIAMICLIGACASSPRVKFYTLGVVPAERRTEAFDAPVQIGAVHIPSVLDRQEMVRESGANQLEMSNEHRWGAPLAEMTRRVLTQDLQARLPLSMVVLPEQPAPPHIRVIVIDILKFESEFSGRVVLQGSWSLVAAGSDTPTSSRPMQIDEAAPAQDYAAQAQAMSRAVGRLADSIADALAQQDKADKPAASSPMAAHLAIP